jgi:hypothetical protein
VGGRGEMEDEVKPVSGGESVGVWSWQIRF